MLDNHTKKRIDDCRDILVGKLPDPKAQIEQITIGLIYKFMDDMDKESIELGGKAKFFTDYKVPNTDFPEDRSKDELVEFKKYSWDKLLNPKVSAADMLRLYSEAIEKMEKNPNIPQLFRDIFNNAYLPYRDPETLKLFLKTINGFEYTHSEKLGDAFEYLLSVMGSQGDAGQFRTPRHIIDFLVEIVDPGKMDSILDPACGTAGFLISAFKHIRNKNKGGFTPEEQKRLIKNFVGYDISPDMVRLSLVNLYLHGFSDPHIHEYDTLSSEDRWNEGYDVILANPPFMSPKGGIRPHKKFSISSNRSEVLFVDYIAEHLNPDGKAGVIVPEGIIFQSGKAYKDLRKTLVEGPLYAVVSLPAGVFNPYSGVKTSILLMDKTVANKRDKILFVKIDNDGYNLGAQRTAVKGGQLEEAITITHEFAKCGEIPDSLIAHAVLKTEIAANGDYNLSGDRYRVGAVHNTEYEFVSLDKIVEFTQLGLVRNKQEQGKKSDEHPFPYIKMDAIDWNGQLDLNKVSFVNASEEELEKLTLDDGDFIYNTRNAPTLVGKCSVYHGKSGSYLFNNNILRIKFDRTKAHPDFINRVLVSDNGKLRVQNLIAGTTSVAAIYQKEYLSIQIPLPPLSIQEEIVAEIEGYQKIIDGAKAVIANYKPKIDIDPDWEMVELETIAQVISGYGFNSSDFSEDNPIRCIKITNVGVREFVDDDSSRLPENFIKEYSRYAVNTGDLVISLTRTIISSGLKVAVVPESWNNTLVNQRVAGLKPTEDSNIQFLYHYLCSDFVYKYVEEQSRSLMQPNLSVTDLKKLHVPNPPIDIQNEIVQQIQVEQALVNANKQLIEIFEQKIKDRIAKVWGEEKQAEPEMAMAAEAEVEYEKA